MKEHSVIIHVELVGGERGSDAEVAEIGRVLAMLDEELKAAGVGEVDGDEFGGYECVVYSYGENADTLFDVCKRVVSDSHLFLGAIVVKRYGDAGDFNVREEFDTISRE